MRESRNPFRLRASEQIETDAMFIRLFEPSMLELLPQEGLWDRPQILRSAPGAGKTSLLRLFTPTALLNLHTLRTHDFGQALFQKLSTMDAVDESGPRLLGVLLSCARNYATLEDLDCDASRKTRLLYGLLNARILLATLRGAVALKRLDYPAGLSRIELVPKSEQKSEELANIPTNGKELHDWAMDLEATVCDAIDSFGPFETSSLPGHSTLISLLVLKERELRIDGAIVADRLLIMLDDVHKLTQLQRESLFPTILDLRPSCGFWMAERFEALTTNEMLSLGATQGRDFGDVILLEQFWRQYPKRFEHLVMNVANRRAGAALDGEISTLAGCLGDSLEDSKGTEKHREILAAIKDRVQKMAAGNNLFADWLGAPHLNEGTVREQALAWRVLEILMEREMGNKQQGFDFSLSVNELEKKDGSDVRNAADLFISEEFKLPYYFGPSRLAALSSSNVEQFLRLAGDEFEELVAQALLKKEPLLTPERQHAILVKGAGNFWKDIPRRARNAREVLVFLDSIGRFCRWTTYQPNAPYSPGVNGIAISMADRERLLTGAKPRDAQYGKLADVLAACLAQNLLDTTLNYKCKGVNWMVLYLNRLLCAHFGLPLGYGGFKEKKLKDLATWLDPGYREPKKDEQLI
jgi:hypothetical protein